MNKTKAAAGSAVKAKDALAVVLGDAVRLTQGPGGSGNDDKRYLYQ